MSTQGYEQLALFPEASRARAFPWLESDVGRKMSVTYGRKCCGLSENLCLVGLSLRTYLESCVLPGIQFARIWSVKATMSAFLIMKLRLSERRTGEKECSLWQTPNVPNGGRVNPVEMTPTGMMPDGRKRQVGLEHQVKMVERKIWPTPVSRDYKDGSAESCRNVPVNGHLGRAVHLWPTPKAQNARGNGQTHGEGGPSLDVVAGGTLNPDWVEWLMGFPVGWTNLPEYHGLRRAHLAKTIGGQTGLNA